MNIFNTTCKLCRRSNLSSVCCRTSHDSEWV